MADPRQSMVPTCGFCGSLVADSAAITCPKCGRSPSSQRSEDEPLPTTCPYCSGPIEGIGFLDIDGYPKQGNWWCKRCGRWAACSSCRHLLNDPKALTCPNCGAQVLETFWQSNLAGCLGILAFILASLLLSVLIGMPESAFQIMGLLGLGLLFLWHIVDVVSQEISDLRRPRLPMPPLARRQRPRKGP